LSDYFGFKNPGLISKKLFNWVDELIDEACWASLADPPDPISLSGRIKAKIGSFVFHVARLFYWVEMKYRAILSVLH